MARALVLGGLGGIGSVAVRALAAVDDFDQVVIADVLGEEAETAAAQFGDSRITGIAVDAQSHTNLTTAMKDADVVLNCTGPFYRFDRQCCEQRSTRASITSTSVTTLPLLNRCSPCTMQPRRLG